MTVLCLIAFHRVDEGTLFQGLFNLAGIHLTHGLVEWVQACLLQSCRDVVGFDKAINGLVLNVDDNLIACIAGHIRFVECGDSHDEISGKH